MYRYSPIFALAVLHLAATAAEPQPTLASDAQAAAQFSAQTSAHTPALKDDRLERVIVNGRRLEEDLPQQIGKYGAHIDVISSEAIQRSSFVDVSSALEALAPSLYISQKNGPFDYVDISLLGSRTEDVLWLVDGVRINNRLYSSTTPLDTMPAGIVDRLEVLEGGQALFYGTQAVAGAINIVTKQFSDKPDGSVTLGLDTNNGHHADGYYRDGLDRQQFVAYASVDKSNGYRAFRDQDYQPSATDRDRSYDVVTLGGKYAFNATEALRLVATYQHTDADVDNAMPFRIEKNVNSRKEQIATAKIDYEANDDLALFLKAYYHSWDTHYDTVYNDLGTPGTRDVLYDNAYWGYKDYGLNALAKFKFDDRLEYYVGYDFQKYGGRDEVLVIEQQDERTSAVFAQVHTADGLFTNTQLAAGVRYNKPNVGEAVTIWNASGEHRFNDRLFARTTLGTNFRLPSAEELFANDPLDERGNPQFKTGKKSQLKSVARRFGADCYARSLVGIDGLCTQYLEFNRPRDVRRRNRNRMYSAIFPAPCACAAAS